MAGDGSARHLREYGRRRFESARLERSDCRRQSDAGRTHRWPGINSLFHSRRPNGPKHRIRGRRPTATLQSGCRHFSKLNWRSQFLGAIVPRKRDSTDWKPMGSFDSQKRPGSSRWWNSQQFVSARRFARHDVRCKRQHYRS